MEYQGTLETIEANRKLARENPKAWIESQNNKIEALLDGNAAKEPVASWDIDYYWRQAVPVSELLPKRLSPLIDSTTDQNTDLIAVDVVIARRTSFDKPADIEVVRSAVLIRGRAARRFATWMGVWELDELPSQGFESDVSCPDRRQSNDPTPVRVQLIQWLEKMWKRDNSVFSYEILWRAAHTALSMAEIKDPCIRVDHLSIHSILTAFLAFEGFINFVGDEIAPEIWSKEREFFSRKKFRGIVGKIEYLFTLFPNKELQKEKEPYLTFRRVKETRDNLAHNRVLHYGEITPDGKWSFRTKWEDFDTPDKIMPALQQLKEFAELIRVEAVKLLKEDYALSHLHFKAFEGPLGGSEGTRIG